MSFIDDEEDAWNDFIESQGGLEEIKRVEEEKKKAENNRDETYSVALYTYKHANIGGPREKDIFGWEYGDYGCGEHLQVVVDCLFRDEEGYNPGDKIDHYLPALLFVGKKEGDTLEVSLKTRNGGKRTVTLILDQTNPDYGGDNANPFEDVFKDIITTKRSTCSPGYYTPELSKEEQTRIFNEFLEAHFK